jgi:flagellar biosynthesis GTPase FlhF
MKPADLRGNMGRSFLCRGQEVPEYIEPAEKQRLIDKMIGQQEDRAAVAA